MILRSDGRIYAFAVWAPDRDAASMTAKCHLVASIAKGMVQLDSDIRRALVEQAHQLHELTKHPGWAVYLDYLNTVMIPLKKRILNDGGIDTLDEYKKVSGYLAGIHRAIDVPAEVGKMADNARVRAAEQE